MPTRIEICVDKLACALAAQRGGAGRIELCADLATGGLTPALDLMRSTREQLRIPIHAMIRSRPGNFHYTDAEYVTLRQQITAAKDHDMDAVVLGLLGADNKIDIARTTALVALAHPLPITFHRAFDETPDLFEALESVIETGATRILTSGGCATAAEGASTLSRLIAAAANRIIILPAAGITEQNVATLIQQTGASEVHASVGAAAFDASVSAELSAFTKRVHRLVGAVADLKFHPE
jgi:copper homeostasis protein